MYIARITVYAIEMVLSAEEKGHGRVTRRLWSAKKESLRRLSVSNLDASLQRCGPAVVGALSG